MHPSSNGSRHNGSVSGSLEGADCLAGTRPSGGVDQIRLYNLPRWAYSTTRGILDAESCSEALCVARDRRDRASYWTALAASPCCLERLSWPLDGEIHPRQARSASQAVLRGVLVSYLFFKPSMTAKNNFRAFSTMYVR